MRHLWARAAAIAATAAGLAGMGLAIAAVPGSAAVAATATTPIATTPFATATTTTPVATMTATPPTSTTTSTTTTSTTPAGPTLGLTSYEPLGAGFGQVEPAVINQNGDPTSVATDIHWTSWGGARAVGHGYAYWVWPGWSVAGGSVKLKATVVALKLSTCNGQAAYTEFGWYFAGIGQTLQPFPTNICTGKYFGPENYAEHNCAQVLVRGATNVVATQISAHGFTCAQARSLAARVTHPKYVDRAFRLRSGRYFCGNEYKTDPTPVECANADATDDVSFSLSYVN